METWVIWVASLTIIAFGPLAVVVVSLVRFVCEVGVYHACFGNAPEAHQDALRCDLIFEDSMPRKDPTFSCDDIVRFFWRNLTQDERRCVLGRLMGQTLQNRGVVISETTLGRWRRAVSNVRTLARFLPQPIRGMVFAILAVMDLVIDVLMALFEERPNG